MSVKIEIVQGFMESGKTSFINSMLKREEIMDENIVVILTEYGENEIDEQVQNLCSVIEEECEKITEEYIRQIIAQYNPDRIFIECNGMKDSTEIIDSIDNLKSQKIAATDDVLTILDLNNFEMFYKNMTNLMASKIQSSTSIILNNMNDFSKDEIKKIKKQIKNINLNAKLLNHMTIDSEDYYEEIDRNLQTIKITLGISLVVIAGIIMVALSTMDKSRYDKLMSYIYGLYISFISLVIEGIPFVLVGSFFSGIIGVMVPKEKLMKVLPENKILSCVIASFTGLFLPICDCGTIPIMKSLVKKGANVGCAVTFMLSAPIVNPICILATYYAFQGNTSVILCRIFSGVSISIICGIIINYVYKDKSQIFAEETYRGYCDCDMCSRESLKDKSIKSRMFNIIDHSTNEFFNVAKYMIFGMFICSIFQTTLIKDIVNPGDNRSGLIIMMILGVLLSVCSTSDAFIGKTFMNQFSLNSVMGFLVVGPMIDIKNMIVMSSFLKKKFILKLFFIILTVSFSLMINLQIS